MAPNISVISFRRSGVDEALFERFQERLSKAMDEMSVNAVSKGVISSLEELSPTIKPLVEKNPDLVILFFSNYINENIPLALIREIRVPVLFWVVSGEDAKGLPLSGFLSTASNLKHLGKPVNYVLGAPEDKAVKGEIEKWAAAASAIGKMRRLKIGLIGHNPPGMLDVTLHELELLRLGINVLKLDLLELVREIEGVPEEVVKDTVPNLFREFDRGIEVHPSDLERSARLYLGLRKMVEKNSLDVVAVRCWPELIQRFGATICFAFSKLADQNEAIGVCEADSTGAVSMVIANLLSKSQVFIADLSTTIPAQEAVRLWHCGAAPCALAEPSCKIRLTHHGLRPGVGVQCSFPMKRGPVTLLKLLRPTGECHRMFIGAGESISLQDQEEMVGGNIADVRVRPDLRTFIDKLVDVGAEHHIIMAYGEITDFLSKFCRLLEIEELRVK
jgi:L-fucose isomerase-like protein